MRPERTRSRGRSHTGRVAGALPLTLFVLLAPAPLAAQGDAAEARWAATIHDAPGTRRLHDAARAARSRFDQDVLGYTAVVRERGGVDLRLPLRDRTLYRTERASRVFWTRDGEVLVQVLGARELEPGMAAPEVHTTLRRLSYFDPGRAEDRLFLGILDESEEEVWFHHPLGPAAEEHYRFRTGGSLTLSLPDGRSLSAVELQVLPRAADARRISGSLWIEPESGALVRAAYRMSDAARADVSEGGDEVWVPGIFRPFTGRITLVAVDYALWDFRVWLPRSMRIEGLMSAGVLEVPASFEVSYRMESVTLKGDRESASGSGADVPVGDAHTRHFRTRSEALAYLAELMGAEGDAFLADSATTRQGGGRSARYFLPADPAVLLRSADLPPPIWRESPGFATDDQLAELLGTLARLPVPGPAGVRWAFNWGHERPDLLRYNRVEGPAVGARLELLVPSPIGPVTARLQPFFGVADRDPKARLTVERETLRRKSSFGAYRELEPVSRGRSHLGLGNSASALIYGRDEGEYFMATGAEVRVLPPSARRQSWELRLYGERHSAVETNSSFSLAHAFDGDWSFRSNVEAEAVSEVGASLLVSPWWGTDPLAPQGGVELFAHGATGDRRYGRVSLTLRGAAPLFERLGVGAELGAGESWGAPPIQRSWFLGGSHTLRGYDPSSLVGPSFVRGRLEVHRRLGALGVAVFGDGAWAGEGLDAFREQDALVSAGAGLSLLGGVVRLDLARGLRHSQGLRLHLYLDGIF
jgi:hypothetical protein